MTCGYWLRLNGSWVPLEGVQAGVGYGIERPSSSSTTTGGVRRIQSARRAARDMTLDFGQASPEAVTALRIAAQGDGSDVQLWDESVARENLLDPIPLSARPGYPVVDCGGMPLVSMTAGEEAARATESVSLRAQVTVRASGGSLVGDLIALSPGETEALVKATIPPTPAGMQLLSADLILSGGQSVPTATVRAHAVSNAWLEVDGADYWSSVPAGVLLGSAVAAPSTVVPLGDVTAHVGTDLSVRLSQEGAPAGLVFDGRWLTSPPMLRLTYAVLTEDRLFEQHLRPGTYTLACWTDALGGTQIGTIGLEWAGEWVMGPLLLPDDGRVGLRYVAITVVIPEPGQRAPYRVTIDDSVAYLLAGLMISTLDHPGVYMHPQKTPISVAVEDPALNLDRLLPGEQGVGQRTVVVREVGV